MAHLFMSHGMQPSVDSDSPFVSRRPSHISMAINSFTRPSVSAKGALHVKFPNFTDHFINPLNLLFSVSAGPSSCSCLAR